MQFEAAAKTNKKHCVGLKKITFFGAPSQISWVPPAELTSTLIAGITVNNREIKNITL